MFVCFICSSVFSSISQLMFHFQIYHNLSKKSMYKCNQQGCIRDFDGSEKFRQHLKRVHSIPDVTHQFSFNDNCQTSDIPIFDDTTPVLNLSEEVVNTSDGSIHFEDVIGIN